MTGGGGGASLTSEPLSPITQKARGSNKRTRSMTAPDSSPGSFEEVGEEGSAEERRRQPGVKRACNECRQQKLRCDVVQEPFAQCSRCRRLSLECKIQSNFKRVGKRSKNAEMERELAELRRQLASNSARESRESAQTSPLPVPATISQGTRHYDTQPPAEHYMGSDEAVASLLDLRHGIEGGMSYLKGLNGVMARTRSLDGILLSQDRVERLFNEFFKFYHPFLPLLDPSKTTDQYYETSQLLFWVVILIASRRSSSELTLLTSLGPAVTKLIWSTLGDSTQFYHLVKALCLICTWPLPVSSTSADPTFMLSGVMMHVAMQIGLHRPSHAQDFARFHVQLREEDLKDRVKTWAACNIVAQSVGTGYGQPASTLYDWTLETSSSKAEGYQLPEELEVRLRIEKFCDKVTKALYGNRGDPVGLTGPMERSAICDLLVREYQELESQLGSGLSPMNSVYLRAAGLHLRLTAFFDSSTTTSYRDNLFSLYWAANSFLAQLLSLEIPDGRLLSYATNYVLQMTLAGGFTLLKLLNSFFAVYVNLEEGKALFNKYIWVIREISVRQNDLPARLAEVLAQLWHGGGAGAINQSETGGKEMNESLMLKVRCRMSMSLVFDSVWRWREEFQAKGRGNLDSAVTNPTNPDSASDPAAAAAGDLGLATPNQVVHTVSPGPGSMGIMSLGPVTPGPNNGYGEANYEVFDPLNWMLDGFVDFPYPISSLQGGLETNGIA